MLSRQTRERSCRSLGHSRTPRKPTRGSLGVAKTYRRLGIGTYILNCIAAIAGRMGKGWLEVDVLLKNIPAQRFYMRFGFSFVRNGRAHWIVRGRKPCRLLRSSPITSRERDDDSADADVSNQKTFTDRFPRLVRRWCFKYGGICSRKHSNQ